MILVLSDIHGNLEALNAILEESHRSYSIEKYVILGDSYTLGPSPVEVFDLLNRLENAVFIDGNHEDYLVENIYESNIPQIGNFLHGSLLYQQFQSSLKRTTLCLGAERILQIPNIYLKEYEIEVNGVFHYFCHGQPNTNKVGIGRKEAYLYLEKFLRDCFWGGHIHYQFLFEYENKRFVNPGGAGLPFDGDYRAPYAVIDRDGIPHLHRAEYPYLKTVEQLQKSTEDLFVPILQNHLRYARLVRTGDC